jgi:hypothetical protein
MSDKAVLRQLRGRFPVSESPTFLLVTRLLVFSSYSTFEPFPILESQL